jgi:hypothetical protein
MLSDQVNDEKITPARARTVEDTVHTLTFREIQKYKVQRIVNIFKVRHAVPGGLASI